MVRYVASRLVQAFITILGISVLVFVLARLSGDATALLVPTNSTHDQYVAIRASLGLDKPVFVQYWLFLKGALSGDFGRSFRYGDPALHVFWQHFPNTVVLALVAAGMALAIGIAVGVLSSVRPNGLPDRVSTVLVLLGQAVPSFWVATLLIMVFSVKVHWLPTSGKAGWKTYLMPAFALSWYSMAALARMTRSSMIDVLETDYIRLARLKGLPEHIVIWKHAFKNAMLPILTLFSLQLIFFISGSVIVETIFAWPGIGQLTVQAIDSRDYPLVQTIVLVTSSLLVLLNLLVDILYAYIDPRIRLA
jgi:ABC-type dipeptide/oligopeptide/nickel transport system permease component